MSVMRLSLAVVVLALVMTPTLASMNVENQDDALAQVGYKVESRDSAVSATKPSDTVAAKSRLLHALISLMDEGLKCMTVVAIVGLIVNVGTSSVSAFSGENGMMGSSQSEGMDTKYTVSSGIGSVLHLFMFIIMIVALAMQGEFDDKSGSLDHVGLAAIGVPIQALAILLMQAGTGASLSNISKVKERTFDRFGLMTSEEDLFLRYRGVAGEIKKASAKDPKPEHAELVKIATNFVDEVLPKDHELVNKHLKENLVDTFFKNEAGAKTPTAKFPHFLEKLVEEFKSSKNTFDTLNEVFKIPEKVLSETWNLKKGGKTLEFEKIVKDFYASHCS